jgi:hypothetical protein
MKITLALAALCLLPAVSRAGEPGAGVQPADGAGEGPRRGEDLPHGEPPRRDPKSRPPGQITTGGTMAVSKYESKDLAPLRLENGKFGSPGVCFTLYAERSTSAKAYGEMCSYGDVAPSGRKPLHETFYWFARNDAWVDGRAYFFRVKGVRAWEYSGPKDVAKTETFPNNVGCRKASKSIPASKRWAAKGAAGTEAYLVRSEADGSAVLLGHWLGATCVAVEPTDDGWIEFKPSTEAQTAKAFGTAN